MRSTPYPTVRKAPNIKTARDARRVALRAARRMQLMVEIDREWSSVALSTTEIKALFKIVPELAAFATRIDP